MAGAQSLDARLAALQALREADVSELTPALTAALRGKTSLVVAKAARLAAARNLTGLLRELEGALDRFQGLPDKDDRNCAAKSALIDACDDLGSKEARLFLRGVRCVHMEPVWGGQEDRAAGLRARSLLALFRLRHLQAMNEAVRLLLDPLWQARAGAARAIANGSPLDGVPLLRYKALVGDEEGAVLEEVLGALLALEPDGSLEFVAELLDAPDEATGDVAAMALAGTRRAEACEPLLRWAAAALDRRVRVAFSALAILRAPPALAYLLSEIREAEPPRARAAVEALAPFAYDAALAERVREAAHLRPQVLRAYEESFGRAQG